MALNVLRRLGGVNPLGGGVQGPLVGGAGGAMGLGTPGLGGGPSPGGLGGGMMPALGGPLAGATGFGGPDGRAALAGRTRRCDARDPLGRPGSPPRRNGGEPATRSARPRQIALTPAREGGRAGDLREVPAVPVGGQLPETPGSDEGGEEGDLTGRRVGPAADRKRGRTPAPPAPARRNGSSVVMTTETEFNISEEPLAERVLRQVRSGQIDESGCCPRPRSGRGTWSRSSTGSRRGRAGTPSWPARRTRWQPGKRPRSETRRSWRWSRSCAGGRRCRGSRPIGWRSSTS